MKITIVGAGNVGSTLACRIMELGIADVVLLDIAGDLAKAKALDIQDGLPFLGCTKKIIGTSDYEDISGSDVVIITAGFPRMKGMSREDLALKNVQIIKEITGNIKRILKESIVIVVTNPLDVMVYFAYKSLGYSSSKILGMAGNLDTARFKNILHNELGSSISDIETMVLGSHGDTMVPLISHTFINKKSLKEVSDKEKIDLLIERVKKRGGEIVSLLKSGSAYFSPSAACLDIIKAITNNERRIIPCSVYLNGEYGLKDVCTGVPVRIGADGVQEVIEFELAEEERRMLKDSAEFVRHVIGKIKKEGV